jgi:hypothetical protein
MSAGPSNGKTAAIVLDIYAAWIPSMGADAVENIERQQQTA